MLRVCENGAYRDMTPDEESKFNEESNDALTEMAEAMSTATTLAQMRSAAKKFLEKTEA